MRHWDMNANLRNLKYLGPMPYPLPRPRMSWTVPLLQTSAYSWQRHFTCLARRGEGRIWETERCLTPWQLGIYSRVPLISQNVTEGLHNGFLGAILCQSQPKKNSDFYLHFWPLAPHFGGAVGANGKTAQKWLKKYQIFKLAENPFKSWKSLKPNAIPIFLGDVGLIKVVSKFSFGHP